MADAQLQSHIGFLAALSPLVLARHLALAELSARALPETIDVILFYIWAEDLRGLAFPVSGDDTVDLVAAGNGFRDFGIWVKEAAEGAERQGGVKIDGEADTKNITFLFWRDAKIDLRRAVECYFQSVACGQLWVAPKAEVEAVCNTVRERIYAWLNEKHIQFYCSTPVHIPGTALQNILVNWQKTTDVFWAPNIPDTKIANATQTCGVVDDDSISALVDCTFWGSAKDAVIFGTRGIYYHNSGMGGYLPYSEFPERTFNNTQSDACVSLGPGSILNLEGSGIGAQKMIGMLDAVKSEAVTRTQRQSKAKVGISGIAGMQELKHMLLDDVVAPLRDPEKYKSYGLSIPNGILLYGPPGCGKTFIAKLLAEELGYTFFEISPSAVASPYIHDTSSRVRDLFTDAAKHKPAVIFVDEFDGLVPNRRGLGGEQQYKAEEVNEWLVQINACAERGILFIAATNEPWMIDEAARRTGRLDKKVYVGPPDGSALEQMLRYHLKGRPIHSAAEVADFARQVEGQGYSASDVKVLVDEAARFAMSEGVAIGFSQLSRAAAEKVPPSITQEQQEPYLLFARC